MTQIKLDKALAEDLITSKLHILKQYIDDIFARCNGSSSKEFLEKARVGVYVNAEDNTVELKHLLLDYTKRQEILKKPIITHN